MNRYIQFIETSYKNIDPLLGDKVGLFEKHPNLLSRDLDGLYSDKNQAFIMNYRTHLRNN